MRPQIADLEKNVQTIATSVGIAGSLVDQVMQRLKKYSVDLEHRVVEQALQLIQERKRCDSLFSEMLPKYMTSSLIPIKTEMFNADCFREIVQMLRTGFAIEPEFVDDVSVLFCDIYGFVTFVASSLPEDVLAFLHEVYSAFDGVVGTQQVYKMEIVGSIYLVSKILDGKHICFSLTFSPVA